MHDVTDIHHPELLKEVQEGEIKVLAAMLGAGRRGGGEGGGEEGGGGRGVILHSIIYHAAHQTQKTCSTV